MRFTPNRPRQWDRRVREVFLWFPLFDGRTTYWLEKVWIEEECQYAYGQPMTSYRWKFIQVVEANALPTSRESRGYHP